MTLGWTVEALVPAARGGGALRMGLRRLAEQDWLQRNVDLTARAAVFDALPDSVQRLPWATDAEAEAAAMIGVPDGDLEAAGRSVWEDLCIVQSPPGGGVPVLAAGAVAFPTDWRLADKIGLPLAAVHAPIHGYAEQLSTGVDHLVATLPADTIVGRANWFVVATDALAYLPDEAPSEQFAHVTAENAGETLFVRCERQTMRRLPETGAILFTIGVHVAPLGSLSDAVVTRIVDAVANVPAGERERRAAPGYSDAIAGYARRNRQEAA
ncbi:heme-dependent oxidative N-demethylase family protein [Sphingomonas sp. RS2018]